MAMSEYEKRMLAETLRHNKEMEEVAATAVHELGNKLQAIKRYLEDLSNK